MANSPIRKASDLLASVLPVESMDRTNMWSDFFKSWKYIAGERFCVHAKPVDLRNGIVVVEADHPGWIQLLQFEQTRILKKLQDNFPELKLRGIAFKVKNEESSYSARDIKPMTEEAINASQEDESKQIESEKTFTPVSLKQLLDTVEDTDFRALLGSVADTLEEAGKNRKKSSH